jgi:Pin2-interacting protein X1
MKTNSLNYDTDDTKIGQKLLEKMGWAKGKGLGREEQGDLEPIRLKYKNDAEGVGYEAKDDQWVAHREEFNNILVALNGNLTPVDESEPVPIKSLEVRSKSSKTRVHYHKFTRGKDLSRYSASDMACILGKRAVVEVNQEEKEPEEPIESSNGSVEHLHGVTTIQRGSIQEYFATKMAAAKEKQLRYLANGNDEQNLSLNDSTNGEKRVRINEDLNIVKEFCSKEKILKNEIIVQEEAAEESQIKKKKKKSKKLEEESIDIPSEPLPITEEVLENLETKKKKKKKKDKEQFEEVITEPVIEAEPIKIKKSKKRKIEEVISQSEITQIGEEDPNTQPESKKKKKKSKKQEEPEAVEETVEVIEPKVKKSKKNKTLEVAIEVVQNEEEPPSKKKKKKSKKNEEAPTEKYTKMENSLIENEPTAGEIIQNSVAGDSEQPPKKKKKKNKKGDEEAPGTFRKIEEIEFESKLVEEIKSKPSDEVVSIQNEARVSKKNKKNKASVEETPETNVKEDEPSQNAQDNSTKDKSKKRRASDATDKVAAVNVKQDDVGAVQSTEEPTKDKKNIDKKVCSADQLPREADKKPDDSQQELDGSRIKDKSTISTEEVIETENGGNLNILQNFNLNDSVRVSQKINRRLMQAKFDQFVGK